MSCFRSTLVPSTPSFSYRFSSFDSCLNDVLLRSSAGQAAGLALAISFWKSEVSIGSAEGTTEAQAARRQHSATASCPAVEERSRSAGKKGGFDEEADGGSAAESPSAARPAEAPSPSSSSFFSCASSSSSSTG